MPQCDELRAARKWRIGAGGLALMAALFLISFGCGGREESGDDGGAVEAPPANSLLISSQGGCAVDEDCSAGYFCFQQSCAQVCSEDADCDGARCTERGRCTTGDAGDVEDIEVPNTLVGVEIDAYPDPLAIVGDDDASITFEFGVDGQIPAQGVPYRLSRSDGESDDTRIQYAPGEGDSFSITVEPGAAAPQASEPQTVTLMIHTAVGTQEVALQPQPSLEGIWRGRLAIDEMGGQEFPMELLVAGEEPEDMMVGLPVDRASLFTPHTDFETSEHSFVELEYREHLNVYQAVLTSSFDLGDAVFADLDADQVERQFRFDFDADALDDGELVATVSDRWVGAHNGQDAEGQLEVGQLSFLGEVILERRDALPADVDAQPAETDDENTPHSELIGATPIEACGVGLDAFNAPEVTETIGGDEKALNCDGIDSVADFEDGEPGARAECALAVTHEVYDEEMTADQINEYFAGEGQQDVSFEDFLKACADSEDETCEPNERAVCAFELIGNASRDIRAEHFDDDHNYTGDLRRELMSSFIEMSRESFLARQLGAFYTDMELRRDWLRQGSAPAAFVSAIQDSNEALMDDWREEVLDVHRELFTSFFRPSAITFMGQPSGDADVNEQRRGLLQEATSLWRSYADALQLAARRWDEITDDEAQRNEHVDFLHQRAIELYVTMGILMEFNRAAGIDAQSSLMASDFASLIDSIETLDETFDEALFARDAEVVTARSLDPLTDNDSLLQERRQRAFDNVEEARTSISEILDDVTVEALQEEDMRNQLENERREAANEIAGVCGLPPGCDVDSLVANPGECLSVDAGQCGLNDPADGDDEIVFDPQRVAASEAGNAILDVLEAFEEVEIQHDELQSHLQMLDLEYEELSAFHADVERWNNMRLDFVAQLQSNLSARDAYRDERIEEMVANFEQRTELRQEGIETMQERIAEWDQIRVDGARQSYRNNLTNLSLRQGGQWSQFAGDLTAVGLNGVAKALPKVTGTSVDATSVARAGLWVAGQTAKFSGRAVRMSTEHAAQHNEAQQNRDSALGQASMQNMQEEAELDETIQQAEIDELRQRMQTSDQLTDDEIARLEGQIELMEASLEAELAYERDIAEFREKRSEHHQNHLETSGRRLRLAQSEFNVMQRTNEYRRLVNDARLEAARFHEIDDQLTNLDSLVGGVGAIFTQSHKLNRAERYLNRSRQALMDWLVTLEYYAVRPFIEERIQIMLARNAFQLEEIAERLLDLQDNCGGSERSTATDTISLRQDVLGLTRSTTDEVTGREFSPDERFRNWLQNSHIPIDRRVRWSTSSSLGSVLSRDSGVYASAFPVRLDQFSNLPLACNAKIESVALQVVGDELGDTRPAVSLLYEGTGQIRSCQPDIDDYVDAFGQGQSSYGEITQVRVEGRSMSPTAGVNEFPDRSTNVNRTLAGLPVASEYTLLIDSEVGSNGDLDWGELEDVEIEFEYTYQDLFPESCENL